MEYEAIIDSYKYSKGKYYLTIKNIRLLPYLKIVYKYQTIQIKGSNQYKEYKAGHRIRFQIIEDDFQYIDSIPNLILFKGHH